MNNYENHKKIFETGRMCPWEPEHKLFIDKEIAKMMVDPNEVSAADHYRLLYDKKLAKHEEEQGVVETPPADDDLTIAAPQKVLDDKEKRLVKEQKAELKEKKVEKTKFTSSHK